MVRIKEIAQTIKEIVETRIDLIKEEIKGESVSVLSKIVLVVIMVSLFVLFILFLSFSLALYLAQVTGSPYLGFLIVGLIFLLILLLMVLGKDSLGIQSSMENVLNKAISKRNENKENIDNE